jgi:DNA repair protein RadC
MIVAHNHPSGVAEPSAADKSLTEALYLALGMVGIKLLDHFVVGDGEVVSFAEMGALQ